MINLDDQTRYRVMGLVLARRGSRRIPGKAMVDFGGEPLIYNPIRHALASRYVDDVVLSTDWDHLLYEAETYFGDRVTGHRRADDLGREVHYCSFVTVDPHIVAWWREKRGVPKDEPIIVAGLQAVIMAKGLVDECVNRLAITGAPHCETVHECGSDHPYFCYAPASPDGAVEPMGPALIEMPCTQAMPLRYRMAVGCRAYFDPAPQNPTHIQAIPVGKHDVIEIDEPEDLMLARVILERSRCESAA